MRLEVIVESEDPKIFPLNQSEIMIGSGESCDIILNAEGISRKHLKVISSGDQYFVVDQGSTNGSYINEERLIPGGKMDFTSFFPVRLGDNVFLTLLSDEEAADSELSSFAKKIEERDKLINLDDSDATRAISLNKLSKTPKTLEIQQAKKSKSTAIKKKLVAIDKQEDNRFGKTGLFVFLLIAAGIYYHFDQKKRPATVDRVNESTVTQNSAPTPQVKIPPKIEWKIQSEDLISKARMEIYLNDLKCFNPEEKFFCDSIPDKSEKDGVIQVGGSFVFLLEQKKWIEIAKQLLGIQIQNKATGESSVYSPELYRIGLLLSVKRLLTLNNTQNFKDMNFYMVLYDGDAVENIVKYVFAIKRLSIEQIIPYLDDFNLNRVKQYGVQSIRDSENYYSFY
jgi:pSer/pThr/pTyr-binding forkhead associated (FHA) protein